MPVLPLPDMTSLKSNIACVKLHNECPGGRDRADAKPVKQLEARLATTSLLMAPYRGTGDGQRM